MTAPRLRGVSSPEEPFAGPPGPHLRAMARPALPRMAGGLESAGRRTRELCFNVGLLTLRLAAVVPWLGRQPETRQLPVAFLGMGGGADAALMTAARQPRQVRAVVACGRPPRLPGEVLRRVEAPTLLVLEQEARRWLPGHRALLAHLRGEAHLQLVPRGATDAVGDAAAHWLLRHLAGTERVSVPAQLAP
jgi:putative phosphoribosyl transferase